MPPTRRVTDDSGGNGSFFKFRDSDREMKLSETYACQLDWQIYRSGQTPGPGAYNVAKLALPKAPPRPARMPCHRECDPSRVCAAPRRRPARA